MVATEKLLSAELSLLFSLVQFVGAIDFTGAGPLCVAGQALPCSRRPSGEETSFKSHQAAYRLEEAH